MRGTWPGSKTRARPAMTRLLIRIVMACQPGSSISLPSGRTTTGTSSPDCTLRTSSAREVSPATPSPFVSAQLALVPCGCAISTRGAGPSGRWIEPCACALPRRSTLTWMEFTPDIRTSTHTPWPPPPGGGSPGCHVPSCAAEAVAGTSRHTPRSSIAVIPRLFITLSLLGRWSDHAGELLSRSSPSTPLSERPGAASLYTR